MSDGINLEEKMFEMATAVATTAANLNTLGEAFKAHELSCNNRQQLILKTMFGVAGTTILTLVGILVDRFL